MEDRGEAGRRQSIEIGTATLCYIGAWLFVAMGLAAVGLPVHAMSRVGPWPGGTWEQLFGDTSRTVLVAVTAIAAWFLLDEVLSRRARTWNAAREWFPASRFFLVSSAAALAAIALFHLTAGDDVVPISRGPVTARFEPIALALPPMTLALGLVTGLLLRFGRVRARWLGVVPPALGLALGAAAVIAWRVEAHAMVPVAWPGARTLAVVFGVHSLAVVALAALERWGLGRVERTYGLAVLGLWLAAFWPQGMLLSAFYSCLCTEIGPPPREDVVACGIIACAWGAAAAARVAWHRRASRLADAGRP